MDSLIGDGLRQVVASIARIIPGWFLKRIWPGEKILAHLTVVHWDSIVRLNVNTDWPRAHVEMGGLQVFNLTPLTLTITALELRFSLNNREFGKDVRALTVPVPLPAFGRGGTPYEVDIPDAIASGLRAQQSDYEHLQIGGHIIVKTIHGLQRLDVHKNIATPIHRKDIKQDKASVLSDAGA